MIRIEISTTRRFRYLWLKSVNGFDRRVHCARCLKGSYHPDLNPDGMRDGESVTLLLDVDSAPFHYLCGVTGKWENNLHIPFVADRAAGPITIERYGIKVDFPDGGVRILEIMAPIEGVDPAFGTCRNWLFGLQYFEYDGPSKNCGILMKRELPIDRISKMY